MGRNIVLVYKRVPLAAVLYTRGQLCYCISQEIDDYSMKAISSGVGKKWLYFEYVLDVESVGFADRLDVACERK